MGEYWYSLYRFPITLPTDPLSFKSPIFDSLFIRTRIYDELDTYLDAIQQQKGKFWITSKGSGYGKSTMLNYIMRYAIINFSRLKAFPILISVGGADSEEEVCKRFFKGFIQGIFDAQENFKFKKSTSPDLKKLADEFALYKNQIDELKEKMVVANMDELESWFWKACKVLEKWRNNDIISKPIIMIDELDKLTDEANLFLSNRQNIFERLFNDLDAVVFFSSEFSWTQQLHSGTEYTFYQGKIFENLPLIDINDIKMLIESRLMYGPPYMKPQDNPWSEEGLIKLNEIAKGQPRLILVWASLIMNEAAKKQVPTIGPSFVQDVVMKQTVPELKTYFSGVETYGTYLKLKQASQKKLFNLLVIFYTYAPSHEILKIFDEKLSDRTRELGVEMTNEEWNNAIDTLLRFQCIIDKRNSRRLAQDIVSFFQFAEDKNIRLDALPNLLDDLRLEPRVYPHKPDFMEAIARAFDVKSEEWFNKEKLFDWFYSTQDVFTYFMHHHPRNPREAAKKVFEEKFELYIKQNETSLLKFEEEDKLLLRKKPEFIDDDTYQSLVSFNSIDIINKYIEVIKSKKTDLVVRSSKELLGEIMKKIATRCNVEFPEEFQENRGKRAEFYDNIMFPRAKEKYIEMFIDEVSKSFVNEDIVKSTLKASIIDLASFFRQLKPHVDEKLILPGMEYTNLEQVESWLKRAEQEIMILDKDFDEDGLHVLYNGLRVAIDSGKLSSIKVLCRPWRGEVLRSHTLKKRYEAFRNELSKKGVEVEFRILNEDDSKAIHDRYTIMWVEGRQMLYDHPPYNVMIKKMGNIKPVEPSIAKVTISNIDKWWKRAIKLENYEIEMTQ